MSISHRKLSESPALTVRRTIRARGEIRPELERLRSLIPADRVAGPPICIFNFITSVRDGYDVTFALPVREGTSRAHLAATPTEAGNPAPVLGTLPAIEVLSLVHRAEPETLGDTVGALFSYANEYAIISDEFYREVYPDGGAEIEVQFVIHDWTGRLASGVERVLGPEAREVVMAGSDSLEIESGVDDRFAWVKGMLARLDAAANDHQKWDVISGCAHVFPASQVDKLRVVFRDTRERTGDPLQAADAVIEFMDNDPGWAEGGERNGYTIVAEKKPRDPKKYAEASTDLERRQAYCFCPLVRSKMDEGMPIDFCYCGSGWFRQQWEAATGKPVRVDLLQSVLRGDTKCQFAIHLAEDI